MFFVGCIISDSLEPADTPSLLICEGVDGYVDLVNDFVGHVVEGERLD